MNKEEELDWADDIGNTIDGIFYDNKEEPEISELLLPYDIKGDIDMILIKSIRDFVSDREKICYLVNHIQDLSDIETLLYKCLPIKRNSDYSIIATLLAQCLKIELSISQIDNILGRARSFRDTTGVCIDDVEEYLLNLKGLKDFAPVPDWVSVREGENLSLLKTVLPGEVNEAVKERNIEFIAQAHDLFYEIKGQKVNGQGINIDLDEAMQATLSAYSDQENPGQSSAARVFGPVNRNMEKDCISNPYGDGPCRMLECVCRELDNLSEEEEIIEGRYNRWFTGRCEVCLRSIRDLSHAVRMPVEDGGWLGCYCSLDCIRNNDSLVIDEGLNMRLNSMMYTLDDAGIMDRTRV